MQSFENLRSITSKVLRVLVDGGINVVPPGNLTPTPRFFAASTTEDSGIELTRKAVWLNTCSQKSIRQRFFDFTIAISFRIVCGFFRTFHRVYEQELWVIVRPESNSRPPVLLYDALLFSLGKTSQCFDPKNSENQFMILFKHWSNISQPIS